ncbi:hapless 2-like [Coccinella septempunctata]|uniref:hapless 2-like n=1 Tax=Coccinella septempunctata TaxID=41139 RepID=UPI001D06ED98|nr:hapless 2-like [Coccinella septempunctata]
MRLLYTAFLQCCILYHSSILITPKCLAKAESDDRTGHEAIPNKVRRDCHTNPPSFEIRALLIPCSVSYCPCSIPGQPATPRPPDFECQADEGNGRLSNCTKKLIITVRMTNVGRTHCKNQYVVVDHVYDPTSEHKQRLLYPYVLKINQRPIMQTYSLEKESSVNEKSTELVINKNNKNYKGCKTTGEDTTCERVMYKDKPIPYSTGFCCSCDDDKEMQREVSRLEEEQKMLDRAYKRQNDEDDMEEIGDEHKVRRREASIETTGISDMLSLSTESHQGSLTNSRDSSRRDEMLDLEKTLNSFDVNDLPSAEDSPIHIRRKEESIDSSEDCAQLSSDSEECEKNKKKPQKKNPKEETFAQKLAKECEKIAKNVTEILKNGGCDNKLTKIDSDAENPKPFIHPRGGQDCSNKTCPTDVNPETFHQSTHCLVFSKLWYTVFKMSKPTVYHELSLEIFEKHEDLLGHVIWHDITKGKPLTIGTTKTEDTDDDEEVWAGYVGEDPPPHSFGLDPDIHRLLVPEPIEPCALLKYPELKGGPYEWLVVPNYMITYDGDRCDKVGVGFEAFVKQPNRCSMPRGTCLKNQPKDLWCHDHRLEEVGQSGSYFLKYFGFLPRCPIRNTTEQGGQNLSMYFRSAYISTINIELKTDYNLVLRPHAAAVITEVYVDSTNYIKSTVTVKITNTGLVYGIFYVALTDCPLDMPASFNNIQTKSAVIQPQHQHIFVIEIMCTLPEKKFHCSIEAKNVKHELLAFRRIRFQKQDRCLCIWHCVCTCIETDGGLACQPLPFDHYNAAGFHGGLPMAADYVQFTLLEELTNILYHLFLTMTLLLILMGVMKGVIGFFYKPIGEWGLCSMLGLPKPMKNYHEKSLKGREVIYDKGGWPIHPDTKKRVRNASMVVEFSINAIFFLIYPLVMINVIVKRMCFVDATDESDKQPCCLCGQRHQTGECPSLGILKGLAFFKKVNKRSEDGSRRPRRDASIQYSSRESVECSCF